MADRRAFNLTTKAVIELTILTSIIERLPAYLPIDRAQSGSALLGTGIIFVYFAIKNDDHRGLFSYYVLIASVLMLAAAYELSL